MKKFLNNVFIWSVLVILLFFVFWLQQLLEQIVLDLKDIKDALKVSGLNGSTSSSNVVIHSVFSGENAINPYAKIVYGNLMSVFDSSYKVLYSAATVISGFLLKSGVFFKDSSLVFFDILYRLLIVFIMILFCVVLLLTNPMVLGVLTAIFTFMKVYSMWNLLQNMSWTQFFSWLGSQIMRTGLEGDLPADPVVPSSTDLVVYQRPLFGGPLDDEVHRDPLVVEEPAQLLQNHDEIQPVNDGPAVQLLENDVEIQPDIQNSSVSPNLSESRIVRAYSGLLAFLTPTQGVVLASTCAVGVAMIVVGVGTVPHQELSLMWSQTVNPALLSRVVPESAIEKASDIHAYAVQATRASALSITRVAKYFLPYK